MVGPPLVTPPFAPLLSRKPTLTGTTHRQMALSPHKATQEQLGCPIVQDGGRYIHLDIHEARWTASTGDRQPVRRCAHYLGLDKNGRKGHVRGRPKVRERGQERSPSPRSPTRQFHRPACTKRASPRPAPPLAPPSMPVERHPASNPHTRSSPCHLTTPKEPKPDVTSLIASATNPKPSPFTHRQDQLSPSEVEAHHQQLRQERTLHPCHRAHYPNFQWVSCLPAPSNH